MQPDRTDAAAVFSADPFGAFLTYCAYPTVTAGPLTDLRLAVKDNIAVKGQPFTAGLPLFKDRIADRNAASVRLLFEAGARFVGMTRTDAAGLGVTTPDVMNPILPDDIVGGSSGGSAAAVAAGLADIALGTDTGGSVRIPAACCGVFGFKPTQNRISLDGVWPLAPTFDTVGLMARDLASLERATTILLNSHTNRDPVPRCLQLGIDYERLGQSNPTVVAVFNEALTCLADADITLHPVTLPDRHVTSQIHAALVLSEAHALYSSWQHKFNLLPELVRRTLAAAETVAPNTVAAARRDIHSVIEAFRDCCAGLDAIITPTLPVLPPPVGTRRMALNGREQSIIPILTAETCLANITGGPALSLPLAHSHVSAVSLQILAPHGHDSLLLAIGSRLAPLVCERSQHI